MAQVTCAICSKTARERARRAAYLPQEAEIAWPVAVEEVVSLGRRLTVSGASRLTAEDRSLIGKVMERMQVADFRGRLATQLSAGLSARVEGSTKNGSRKGFSGFGKLGS